MLAGLGVFALAFFTDVSAVLWTVAANRGNPWRAALNSAGITCMAMLTVVLVIGTPILLVASVLGHALGSFVMTWLETEEAETDGGEDQRDESAGDETEEVTGVW